MPELSSSPAAKPSLLEQWNRHKHVDSEAFILNNPEILKDAKNAGIDKYVLESLLPQLIPKYCFALRALDLPQNDSHAEKSYRNYFNIAFEHHSPEELAESFNEIDPAFLTYLDSTHEKFSAFVLLLNAEHKKSPALLSIIAKNHVKLSELAEKLYGKQDPIFYGYARAYPEKAFGIETATMIEAIAQDPKVFSSVALNEFNEWETLSYSTSVWRNIGNQEASKSLRRLSTISESIDPQLDDKLARMCTKQCVPLSQKAYVPFLKFIAAFRPEICATLDGKTLLSEVVAIAASEKKGATSSYADLISTGFKAFDAETLTNLIQSGVITQETLPTLAKLLKPEDLKKLVSLQKAPYALQSLALYGLYSWFPTPSPTKEEVVTAFFTSVVTNKAILPKSEDSKALQNELDAINVCGLSEEQIINCMRLAIENESKLDTQQTYIGDWWRTSFVDFYVKAHIQKTDWTAETKNRVERQAFILMQKKDKFMPRSKPELLYVLQKLAEMPNLSDEEAESLQFLHQTFRYRFDNIKAFKDHSFDTVMENLPVIKNGIDVENFAPAYLSVKFGYLLKEWELDKDVDVQRALQDHFAHILALKQASCSYPSNAEWTDIFASKETLVEWAKEPRETAVSLLQLGKSVWTTTLSHQAVVFDYSEETLKENVSTALPGLNPPDELFSLIVSMRNAQIPEVQRVKLLEQLSTNIKEHKDLDALVHWTKLFNENPLLAQLNITGEEWPSTLYDLFKHKGLSFDEAVELLKQHAPDLEGSYERVKCIEAIVNAQLGVWTVLSLLDHITEHLNGKSNPFFAGKPLVGSPKGMHNAPHLLLLAELHERTAPGPHTPKSRQKIMEHLRTKYHISTDGTSYSTQLSKLLKLVNKLNELEKDPVSYESLEEKRKLGLYVKAMIAYASVLKDHSSNLNCLYALGTLDEAMLEENDHLAVDQRTGILQVKKKVTAKKIDFSEKLKKDLNLPYSENPNFNFRKLYDIPYGAVWSYLAAVLANNNPELTDQYKTLLGKYCCGELDAKSACENSVLYKSITDKRFKKFWTTTPKRAEVPKALQEDGIRYRSYLQHSMGAHCPRLHEEMPDFAAYLNTGVKDAKTDEERELIDFCEHPRIDQVEKMANLIRSLPLDGAAQFALDILDLKKKMTFKLPEKMYMHFDGGMELFHVMGIQTGGCQNPEGSPTLNKGLIGYMRGSHKLLYFADEHGNQIGRCLVRLVAKDQKIALHVERFYSHSPIDETVARETLVEYLKKSMTSQFTKWAENDGVMGRVPPIYFGEFERIMDPAKTTDLTSYCAGAFEYCDSGGGMIEGTNAPYALKGILHS